MASEVLHLDEFFQQIFGNHVDVFTSVRQAKLSGQKVELNELDLKSCHPYIVAEPCHPRGVHMVMMLTCVPCSASRCAVCHVR